MISRLLLMALLLEHNANSADPKVFELSDSFVFPQTSGSTWRYGYSATSSLAPDQFRPDSYLEKLVPISFWRPAAGDRYPYVAYNGTKESQTEPTHGWAVRAGRVAMEASNSGQYSLVRFTAPVSGTYQIKARFEGIHFRLSLTDVHVLKNSVHLFDADIEGYGGDSAFHPVEGAHPTASYEGVVQLAAQDTITFAVGYGKNKTHYNDTTGLAARLILLGKPSR